MKAAGYTTGYMGKWHLSIGPDGNYLGVNPEYAHLYGFDYAPPIMSREEFRPGRDRGVMTFTNQAIEFITRNQDKPWFCFVSHHMIHSDVVAPDDIAQEYRDRGYGEVGPYRSIYLAGLDIIDRSVGMLMDALDELDEADDTMVVFLTDNGGVDERHEHRTMAPPHPAAPKFGFALREYSNAPLRDGKGTNYEGGIRVPLIVRWPGAIKAGTVIDTPVTVSADFTENLGAFIELDSYEVWGTNFRDSYLFSANAAQSLLANDVDVYQAYIEMREAWGLPLTIKIGRQEIMLGSEWLVGNNNTPSKVAFTGLSFDGVTMNYAADTWNVTGICSKVAEKGSVEEDGDTDFYGVYATYTGIENWGLEAYWLYLRDGAEPALSTSNAGLAGRLGDTLEGIFGVDQHSDTTTIHTFGIRGAGTFGRFDFEGEVAYQFGDARSAVAGDLNAGFGGFFNPGPASLLGNLYGDDSAEYDAWAFNAGIGYTFDTAFQPRLFLGAAFFEGEDNREDSFGDFLGSFWPYAEDDASFSFNRLFSDRGYGDSIGAPDMSNMIVLLGGANVQITESLSSILIFTYFEADEPSSTNGLLGLPFLSSTSDEEIGSELSLYFDYAYSENLTFEFGYSHFFAADGVGSNDNFFFLPDVVGGNFVNINGLGNTYGYNDDDADYWYFDTTILF